jgi:anti-anti-sigma factor
MAIAVRAVSGDTAVIYPGVTLTLGNSRKLEAAVAKQLEHGRVHIILNFRRDTIVDAAGMGAITGVLHALEGKGGTLKLVAPSDGMQDLMGITRLGTCFDVFATEKAALIRGRLSDVVASQRR